MHQTNGRDSVADVGDLATNVNFRDLPEHIAKDFTFLLRIETFLRMWLPSSRIDTGKAPRRHLRDQILMNLANEIRRYLRLDDCGDTEPYQGEVLDPVIRCLAKVAGCFPAG